MGSKNENKPMKRGATQVRRKRGRERLFDVSG
jgi:hypothetical protein